MVSDSHDDSSCPHELSITDTQVLRLHKASANNTSANTHLSKTELSKMVQ